MGVKSSLVNDPFRKADFEVIKPEPFYKSNATGGE